MPKIKISQDSQLRQKADNIEMKVINKSPGPKGHSPREFNMKQSPLMFKKSLEGGSMASKHQKSQQVVHQERKNYSTLKKIVNNLSSEFKNPGEVIDLLTKLNHQRHNGSTYSTIGETKDSSHH
jgi:hypothetical protein